MFGLVVSDNLLLLYIFWELTTVLSFLLVGHYAERATSRRAAMQALLVTTAGGLAMLVGIIILGHDAGTYLLSELVAGTRRTGVAVGVGVVLVLIGALSQVGDRAVPLLAARRDGRPHPGQRLPARRGHGEGRHLPRRPAGPRLRRLPGWRPIVLALGLVTMLLGGWRALREYDLKLILAFGTVSQLGFLTVMVGGGGRDADARRAGHAAARTRCSRPTLFLVVGIIDHSTGTRDIRRLSWLGRRMPGLFVIAAGATASMAALPPFLGFVAKEADFETLAHSESLGAWAPVVLAGVVCGSVFTTIYSLRFLWGAFARKGSRGPTILVANLHRPPAAFLIAPAILAAAGLFFGLVPSRLDHTLDDYAETLPAAGAADGNYSLELWHGFGLPVLLSIVVLAAGTAAFFGRDRLSRARISNYQPLAQRRPGLRRRHPRRRRGVGAIDRPSPSAARSRSRSR